MAVIDDLIRVFSPSGEGQIHWTSTARSALRPVLLHLRRTGALPDENSEVLVPRWVCTALYNATQKICFPSTQDTSSLRGVFVYHQYGFPQKLDRIAQRCRDRKLFLIENCVNTVFDGPSPQGMGETGLASVFSLPKMFNTVLGGALVARDPELAAFCAEYFRDDEPWISRLSRGARWLHDSPLQIRSTPFHETVYSISDYGRGARPADEALLRADIEGDAVGRRKANYLHLLREFSDVPFFKDLETDVVPFAAPLFGPEEFLGRLAPRLAFEGWDTGIYRFDVARDLFDPHFVSCVPLPVHQNLTTSRMDSLIYSVRQEWRSFNGQR